jgi:(p)ppGpp synthase/HD superfamily hydrolase
MKSQKLKNGLAKIMKPDLQNAVEVCVKYHKGQFRKHPVQGVCLPYAFHPLEVTKMVWSWGIANPVTLCASTNHDIGEDTDCPIETLRKEIGDEATDIVLELTFLPGDVSKEERGKLKHVYMLSIVNASIDAFVIKYADRFVNSFDYNLHDQIYAAKYFHKADVIFIPFDKRKVEIINRFGASVPQNIEIALHNAYKIFGQPKI